MRSKMKGPICWMAMALVLLSVAIPVLDLVANAATNLNLGVTGLSATYDANPASALGSSGTATCQKTSANSINAVVIGIKGLLLSRSSNVKIYLTNTEYDNALLTFKCANENGTLSVSGATQQSDGTWKADLTKNGSVTITFTSPKDASQCTLNVTEISLVEKIIVTTTFEPADSAMGSFTVDGAAITATTSKTQDATIAYNLVATPKPGYQFAGWKLVGENSYSAGPDKASYTYYAPAARTITAAFVPEGTLLFGVNSAQFTSLNEANSYATSLGGAQINLLTGGTLPSGDYTISAGNTLLIPYDAANTCLTNDNVSTTGHYGITVKPTPETWGKVADNDNRLFDSSGNQVYVPTYAYRTLTMEAGANITVQGTLSVSAKHSSGGSGGSCGSTVGKYGHIHMMGGSAITVESGGTLYTFGYITGDGEVEVLSGGVVWEYFQIMDFRGGSITTSMVSPGLGTADYEKYQVLPFSQYYVQNVEVKMTLYYGAKEMVFGNVCISSKPNPVPVEFIGGSGSMFQMGEGTWVTKKYDPSTDRLIISANGENPDSTVSMSGLTVSFNFYIEYSINTTDYVLPLNSNITIDINSGTVVATSDVAALPGCIINVKQGATLKASSDASVFLYDKDQWGGYVASTNVQFIPTGYSRKRGKGSF